MTTETRTGPGWCSQHRRPRSECKPPYDRHSQPLRASDELMRRVEAKAKVMRLDRNAGVVAALEAWVGPEDTSAGAGVQSDGSEDGKPSAARTEPPALAPAGRPRARGKGKAVPPVAADRDIAAEVAELRAMVAEMQDRDESPARTAVAVVPDVTPATAVFMEPGGEPHVPYESPDRSRKRGRAKCSHHVPAGTRCKICEPRS